MNMPFNCTKTSMSVARNADRIDLRLSIVFTNTIITNVTNLGFIRGSF